MRPAAAPVLAATFLFTAGCAAAPRPAAVLPPLERDAAEVHVFAAPLGRDAEQLSFTLAAVSLRRADGGEVALELATRQLSGSDLAAQRLIAWGRVPPGEYGAVTVRAASATLASEGERSRLLVDAEPSVAELDLHVKPGASTVVWAALDVGRSIRDAFAFGPVFSLSLAPQTPPAVALYCTNAAAASVTAADRRARLVSGVLPVGAGPRGIALDRTANRAFVALSEEDQVDVLDLAASRSVGRIRLVPGDGPTELAVAADGTLLVVNARSRTVSFVDPASLAEVGRVQVGDAPSAIRLDRSGPRAYVANRGSGTISVLDVGNRAVAATVRTDPEPIALELSRDGSQLYVAHRGSPELLVLALPSLQTRARAFVGLGAARVAVDPRTDLIYLSRRDERRITVYDPVAFQPIDRFEVPGPVSRMKIDDAENTLLALVPERRAIAVVDLTSRRVLSEIPVGAGPFTFALAGERL